MWAIQATGDGPVVAADGHVDADVDADTDIDPDRGGDDRTVDYGPAARTRFGGVGHQRGLRSQ